MKIEDENEIEDEDDFLVRETGIIRSGVYASATC
jgi:hypothetical protein